MSISYLSTCCDEVKGALFELPSSHYLGLVVANIVSIAAAIFPQAGYLKLDLLSTFLMDIMTFRRGTSVFHKWTFDPPKYKKVSTLCEDVYRAVKCVKLFDQKEVLALTGSMSKRITHLSRFTGVAAGLTTIWEKGISLDPKNLKGAKSVLKISMVVVPIFSKLGYIAPTLVSPINLTLFTATTVLTLVQWRAKKKSQAANKES